MYQLNYLSILLILLAFFIFYNEFNKKLSIADMCLLAIAFIAILRASYNYIQIDNSLNLNSKNNNKYEGFTSKRKSKSKRTHNSNDDKDDGNDNDNDNSFINLKSEESNEYLDIENDNSNNDLINNNNNNDNDDDNFQNLINRDAVNNIDALLGIGIHNKEMFNDIPESKDEIKSMFMPKIVIGKDNNSYDSPSKWNSVFGGDEFNTFNNGKKNKQRGDDDDDDDYSDPSGNRGGNGGYSRYGDNRNGDKCDGGSVGNGNSYNRMNSSDNDIATYTDKKRCGKYNDLRENEDGSLVVRNYGDAKTWYPGYTYLPPSNWDVPQKYPPACLAPSPDTIKLTGLVDRGLPLNVLELNPYNGKIAQTEESVNLTNVGSMLPKFKYEEQPFSKPYI
jgi:hypothetical protein